MEPNTPTPKRRREDRRRTARACDRCRRLKERCEGGIPCTRCIHLGRTCEFKRLLASSPAELVPDVRSPPEVNVNVRDLLERVMYMEKILKHKVQGIGFDLESLRRVARALDEKERDDGGGGYPGNLLPVVEEDAIEEEVCTIDPVEETTTHYSGEFSYWNFSMRVKRHIEDPLNPLQVSNYWRAEQLHSGVSGTSTVSAAIACCPPRHVADFLINVFFQHAETYYFCVDQGWLLDRVDALYTDPGRFGKQCAAVVSIILTVFAIATQYAYLDSPSCSGSVAEFSEDALGTMFYRQAVRFLPEIIEASSLESVQACLLFAVYALPVDASGLGYIYITLTNRLGMQNGMHRQYTGTGLSAAMVETRNRVWWTAYTLERKISIFHGRPLSTHRCDVDAHLPVYREEMQCGDSASTIPYMVASILLTRRLEEFSHEMSLLRVYQKHERLRILSRLVAGKNELDAWWKTLPEQVHHDLLPHHPHFRASKHLRLEYCLVCMFIGRPLLLNRTLSSRSTPTSPEDGDNNNPRSPAGHASHRQELVACCVQAAKEALGLCRTLRDTGPGLARASYIEYSSCRASLLVLIAHSIQDRSARFRAELREGLDMIREMAAAGDSARSEVALLESLERALTRLQYSVEKNRRDGDGDAGSGSDYECFKHWESLWKSGGTTVNTLPENSPRVAGLGAPSSLSGQPGPSPNYREGASPTGLGHSPFAIDALAFGTGGTLPSHPELRVLQEFLAIPGYRFDAAESSFGCLGVPFPG